MAVSASSAAPGPAPLPASAPRGDQAEFVVGGDQDAGVPGQRGEDGARLVPGPELAAVVDVEGNVQPFAGSARGRVLHGPPRLLAEGGGDPGEVQDPGAAPEGSVDVVPAECGSGGTGAVVEGPGDVGGALLEEHHPGAAAGVLTVVHRNALAPQLPQDELAVRVGADDSGPAHPVAEPRDPDGHVRLRPGHMHAQGAAGGQRSGGAQRDHRLSEGQELRNPRDGKHRIGIHSGRSAAVRRSNSAASATKARARSRTGARSPPEPASPNSGPPRPTATAPACQ